MSKTQLVAQGAKWGVSTLDDIAAAASRFFAKKGTAATAKAASRLGYAKLTPKKIGELVRNNKLTAAFVLYEMGDEGLPYLNELASSDSEVRDLLDLIEEGDFTEEEVGELADDVPSADAMQSISDGVAVVGSHERLLALRAALSASEKDHINYSRVRSLGRTLR